MDLSNPSHPVLSGLLRKRQELEAEIAQLEARLHGLVVDVDALDATIRLFAPDLDVKTVRVRPTPRRNGARHGDTAQAVLALLRTGPKPSTEVIEAVTAQRGLSRSDRKVYAVMRNRVMSCLRSMEKRGKLTRGMAGGVSVWATRDEL